MPLRGLTRTAVIIGAAAGGAYLISRYTGIRIGPVEYQMVAGRQQVRALVTVTNHTATQSAYTLLGWQVTAARLAQFAPQPLGLPIRQPLERLQSLVEVKLVEGHWFAVPDITAAGDQPSDPARAEQQRAIPVQVPRGTQSRVTSWTGTPNDPRGVDRSGIVTIWALVPGVGQKTGNAVAQYIDPAPWVTVI